MAWRNRPGRLWCPDDDSPGTGSFKQEPEPKGWSYERLFDRAPVGMGFVTRRQLLVVNDAFCKMTGYEAKDLSGENSRVLYQSEEELERVLKEAAEQIESTSRCVIETRWIRRDGSVMDVEIQASSTDPGDPMAAVCFAIMDITKRNEAEEALARSTREHKEVSSLLESLFDAIPDIIGIQNLDHEIIRYNQAGYDLLNCSPEAVAGKKCYQLLDRTAPCTECATEGTYDTKQPALIEKYVEEMKVWLECRAYPVLDENGDLVRVIEHLRDISARKDAENDRLRMERQIQQAQKMESLGVLAGGIAHDFNNILMTVMGNAELTRLKIPPMSPGHESLKEISLAVKRASELCRQMLAYAGHASFQMQPTDMGSVIEEMSHLLKTSISKKAILNVHVARNLPPVKADPSQLRQVVMNLIINASDAIGDRSGVITVTVGATRCDEDYLCSNDFCEELAPGLYVHLEVSDNGCGMDTETRSRIFDPFFSTKFAGRGLGLAAVMGIVKGHGGGLKVYSERNKGTTFKLLFPAIQTSKTIPADLVDGGQDTWSGSGLILLVDDEESLRALGAQMLEDLGFEVTVACDGRDCIEAFKKNRDRVVLVLLDLTMPKMDGLEAFKELRQLDPGVRVVLTSGYCKQETQARFSGKGLAGVLEKPYSIKELRSVLQKALEAAA